MLFTLATTTNASLPQNETVHRFTQDDEFEERVRAHKWEKEVQPYLESFDMAFWPYLILSIGGQTTTLQGTISSWTQAFAVGASFSVTQVGLKYGDITMLPHLLLSSLLGPVPVFVAERIAAGHLFR
jgi:hypothetical protein